MTDSLKDSVGSFKDGEFKDRVCEKYQHELKDAELMGESLGLPDVGTSIRKYDHGQANSSTVTEIGVKLVFDPTNVDLASVQEGGEIYTDILELAKQTISAPVDKIDLSMVSGEEYEVWVILDVDNL